MTCVLAAGVALLTLAASGCTAGAEGEASGPRTAASDSADDYRPLDARPARRAGPPEAERPVSLRLPSGTVVPVEPAGTGRRGLLGVPDDIGHAGWWQGGARLGDPFGSTLIAGHVDAVDQGLGAFAELLSVHAGQHVRARSGHLEQVFRIRSLQLVPRADLGAHPGIYSVRGARRLTLVTCAPPYLPAQGGYQNLAVVTAVPTGVAHARSRP